MLDPVLKYKDYYAGGSLMPGRQFSSNSYRFGFNGKENDNEVYGVTGTFQDYGFRMYDTRLVRFISADPLIVYYQQYPWYSPYQFAGNKLIQAIDIEGLQEKIVVHYLDQRPDKSLFVKSTDVSINLDKEFELKDKEGKYAKTEVYYELRGTSFSAPGKVIYEPTQETSGGKKPSASYDYTQEPIPGKLKDDAKYVSEGSNIFKKAGRLIELFWRDYTAPDNRVVDDVIEGLGAATSIK